MVKSIADAIDQLLDREQGDQRARNGNRRVKRSDRRARWQPETAETSDVVDVAEINQAERDAENGNANDDLHDQPRCAVQRLRDRREVQMIIAAGGDRGADENSIDEK